jgi:hypothetical protein
VQVQVQVPHLYPNLKTRTRLQIAETRDLKMYLCLSLLHLCTGLRPICTFALTLLRLHPPGFAP